LGLCVNTRSEAEIIRLGHNSRWDIRVDESNKDKFGTFKTDFDKIKSIDMSKIYFYEDEWYMSYNKITSESYCKKYPRPFPCGSIYLFFEPRKYELINYSLDISTSLLTILFEDKAGNEYRCQIFVAVKPNEMNDKFYIKCIDSDDCVVNIFNRIRLIPEQDIESGIPLYKELHDDTFIGFKQRMPHSVDSFAKAVKEDKGFAIYMYSTCFSDQKPGDLGCMLRDDGSFEMEISLINGKYHRISDFITKCLRIVKTDLATLYWKKDFDKSFISVKNILSEVDKKTIKI